MPREAKRRFTKLDTGEVSLVDTPANEKEFAVIKHDNPEATDMGAQATEQQTTTEADRVPVEVDAESESDVVKALEHVNSIVARMENIAKGIPSDDDGATDDGATDDGATDDSATDDDATDVEKASIKSVLAKAGLKGDAMKAALEKLQKAGFDPNQKFPTAKPPITKNADGDDDGGDDASGDDASDSTPMTMDDFASAVQKAAAFTPGRIQKLQEAADILKLVLEAIQPNATPKTRVPTVTTHPNPSPTGELSNPQKKPVMKGAAGELVDAVKNLSGLVEGLGKRVEGIEKARNGSNSVDEEGDTDSNDQTDTEKSFWRGIL